MYYNSYQILRPGYVVIMLEWNHMTRMIRSTAGHISTPASSCRWAIHADAGKNVLVVETTNFNDDLGPRPWRHR